MKKIIFIITSILTAYPSYSIVNNNNPYPGKIFIHSMSEYMSILDTDLNFYWSINNDNKGMDFKLNNSKLSYFHKPSLDLNEAFWIIADHTMTEIDTVQCSNGLTDYHDMIITDNNTYILQAYNTDVYDLTELGGSQFEVVRGILIIQEFDFNHNLIFNWDASDHFNILDYDLFIQPQIPGQTEWMHGNSIDIDYDNNLILSNRRSNEAIKINRITGEIIWVIGGPSNEFEFINDPSYGFKQQHDITRIDNGNLLVFDNGLPDGIYGQHPTSRVAEYAIDEVNKTATLIWEFQNPYGYFSRAMGSAQRLPNGNTFINWGTILVEGQSVGASIMEVDYDKNIVLELKFDNHQSYKATKSDFEFSIPMDIGDINIDGIINVQDIIYAVNYVLINNRNHSIFNLYKIDTNLDHNINVIDIIDIVNRALN